MVRSPLRRPGLSTQASFLNTLRVTARQQAPDATARTVDATAESVEQAAETATFPNVGYDVMNVE